ncbi:hypothetical protein [Mucilaginibacter corticis]|uniref:hypothetical protein n=1 Tax=Mucilaginibacter corticis TaxID=2597670 RepID=UPI001C91F553|nr:hypothetical protein [Mucilaginibacter corticis]
METKIQDNDPALTAQLKAGLKRTHMERFLMFCTLYKMHHTLKQAKITHKPLIRR